MNLIHHFQPLLAIDFWEALVPVVTIILLVLSQVLGGKDKAEAKRMAEQQRRRAQQRPRAGQQQGGQQQGGGDGDPVRQEIDEFLRRAGEQDSQGEDQRREQQSREQQRRENQRRAEEERRRRQAANQPELQRRNYDPMAEDSAHYRQRREREAAQQRPPSAPQTRQRPSAPEIVDAVVVEEVVESGKLSEHRMEPTRRARAEGIGSEFYDSVDAENDLRDAGVDHTYDTNLDELGELDNPLDVGDAAIPTSGTTRQDSGGIEIDFAAAVAGIFQDPVRAKEAIVAREILERPNFDRWQ